MRTHGLNPVTIVLAFVLVFLVLWAGNFFINRAQVTGPLERFLKGSPSVRSYRIETDVPGFGWARKVTLHVELARVEDLRKAYMDLVAGARGVARDKIAGIEISDARDKGLCELYYRIHFSVFEAMKTGSFERMAQVIERESKASGADARAFVDSERVYVALYRGDRYLYEILDRKPEIPYQSGPAGTASKNLW